MPNVRKSFLISSINPGYENMEELVKKRALPTKSGTCSLYCRRDADGRLQRCSRQPCRICPSTGKTTPVSGKPHCQWESCRKKKGGRGAKTREGRTGKIAEKSQIPATDATEREKKKSVPLCRPKPTFLLEEKTVVAPCGPVVNPRS